MRESDFRLPGIVMAGLVPAISMRRAQRFNKTRLA
jgi:hypothetical protein